MQLTRYTTRGGVTVQCEVWQGPYEREHDTLARILDSRRGVLFSSSFEFPGRYTRLDMGFVDPPLVLTARGRSFSVEALNARGRIILGAVEGALTRLEVAETRRVAADRIEGKVRESDTRFPEEQRSRQPSIFSVLRALGELFGSPVDQELGDEHLGLYGAFGYDLVYQFEPMTLRLPRPNDQRDLVLYLPDELLVVDHMK
jgi:anthranilate synthase